MYPNHHWQYLINSDFNSITNTDHVPVSRGHLSSVSMDSSSILGILISHLGPHWHTIHAVLCWCIHEGVNMQGRGGRNSESPTNWNDWMWLP
jgi:hypothetical protein